MNQDMFGPDFFDDAGADGSYSTFSSSEHDHPLSLPLDIFRSNENLTASLETTFQDRSQWPYNGPDWEVGQAPPSAVTPFDDDSLPSRDGYGYAYSYTTENTAHDQTDTGAINPAENPALLYNQNDLRTDANGGLPADFANLDTSDDQPFAESLGPCDSLVQSQELRVETSSRKDSRKPTRRRASGRGSSPSVLTSTTPTNIRTRRGRRPSRGHNGEHRRLPCTWHGCTDTSKNNSELKKHMDKHIRPHRCTIDDCNKSFTSSNDLSRHAGSVHGMAEVVWVCEEGACSDKKVNRRTDDPDQQKLFKRKDNYKQHCNRMHKGLNADHLVQKHRRPLNEIDLRAQLEQIQDEIIELPDTRPQPYVWDPQNGSYSTSDDTVSPFSPNGLLAPSQSFSPASNEWSSPWSAQDMPATRPASIYSDTSSQASSSDVRSAPPARLSPDGSMTSSSIHRQEQREKRPREKEAMFSRSNKRYRTDPAAPQTVPPASEARQSLVAPVRGCHNHAGHRPSVQEPQIPWPTNVYPAHAQAPPVLYHPALQYYYEQHPYHSHVRAQAQAPVPLIPPQVSASTSSAAAVNPQSIVAPGPGRRRGRQRQERPPARTGPFVCDLLKEDGKVCGSTLDSKSNLAKHKVRHNYPYGCTHADCSVTKTFGSKHDWKRHEESQHTGTVVQWRCSSCKRLYDEEQGFLCHMRQIHKNGHPLRRLLADARIDIVQGGGFWCGFCKSIQKIDDDADQFKKARRDHIAHHFKEEGNRIKDWELPDGGITKGQRDLQHGGHQASQRALRTREAASDGSEHSSAELLDSEGGNIYDSAVITGQDEDAEGDLDEDAVIVDDDNNNHEDDPTFLPRGYRTSASARRQPRRNPGPSTIPHKSNRSTMSSPPSSSSSKTKMSSLSSARFSSTKIVATPAQRSTMPYRSRPRPARTNFKCCQCNVQWSREQTYGYGQHACDIAGCRHVFCKTCHESDKYIPGTGDCVAEGAREIDGEGGREDSE